MSTDNQSHQLPSNRVVRELGEVNVRQIDDQLEVVFTVAMLPQGEMAEGWKTGIALDASVSMVSAYGRGIEQAISEEILEVYRKRDAFVESEKDGRTVRQWHQWAIQEGLEKGHFRRSANEVEARGREFLSYLAEQLDEDGSTHILYWSCGSGDELEVVGTFTSEQCRSLELPGPQSKAFGTETRLLPAVRYFADYFSQARRGMYIFLTDGIIADFEEVALFSRDLARQIDSGERNPAKCVLIGVGDKIDRNQMQALDDLETGARNDLWDHKIADEMRDLVDIFAEVADESTIVASMVRIYDAAGRVVEDFSDGMPAKVRFRMPASSPFFELELGSRRIRQPVSHLAASL